MPFRRWGVPMPFLLAMMLGSGGAAAFDCPGWLKLSPSLVSFSDPALLRLADERTPTNSTDYRAMLRTWLENHKHYPESARERGEQGRAVLRFRVDRSGRVLDYAVVNGTGYADLDAAVESMLRGATLPAFPTSMTVPQIEVTVTIRFDPGKR